jgi:tRNA pseudouridine55 synthase
LLDKAKSRKRAIVGILNIDKPLGITSHDAVDKVRRASGIGRVGHAGTLDPAASGVLLVCLGQATRVTEFLMEGRKEYDAQIRLGITTDSGDSAGRVIHEAREVRTSREQIEQALIQFHGRIQQIPPMHSALKHKGTPLYELARRGIEVERSPRLVEIYDLQLTDWTPPSLRLRVECSRGTYIRALARDLGETLGTGAHLQNLVRVASGAFTLDDAISLSTVEESFANGWWPHVLHPLDEALLHFEAVVVDPETEVKIRQGQQVKGLEPLEGPFCRAYSSSGRFIALLRYEEGSKLWQPRKVFDLREADT